jgi:hypothetical protein
MGAASTSVPTGPMAPYASRAQAESIARGRMVGPADWIAAVVDIMVERSVPLWHACAAYGAEVGPVGGARCSYCHEQAAYRNGIAGRTADHALCVARAAHGQAIVPLPWEVTCGCARCGDVYNPEAYV